MSHEAYMTNGPGKLRIKRWVAWDTIDGGIHKVAWNICSDSLTETQLTERAAWVAHVMTEPNELYGGGLQWAWEDDCYFVCSREGYKRLRVEWDVEPRRDDDFAVSDGFGSDWLCSNEERGDRPCGLQVVRPGKTQCWCDYECR